MAETDAFLSSVAPKALTWLKWGGIIFVAIVIIIAGILWIAELKRRKWKIEIHEQKADGKLHTVGRDILQEKKLNMGTKTIYWLKNAKCEVIPPPQAVTDRFKGKEEVDYIRIERDLIPLQKKIKTNYHDPAVNKIIQDKYDGILGKIRSIKTTFFDSDPVRQRYIYIPAEKTLTAKITFDPIDYDMHMMAVNQISNADEFYQSKYEFWKKYGAVIVFGITIVFLIIVTVLTYEYLNDIVSKLMGEVTKNTGILQSIVDKMGGGKPPG